MKTAEQLEAQIQELGQQTLVIVVKQLRFDLVTDNKVMC